MGLFGTLGSLGGGMLGASKDNKAFKSAQSLQWDWMMRAANALKWGRNASAGQFDEARQQILGREMQGQGDIASRMGGSGLMGSSLYGNLLRGNRADTNRSLSGLASQEASTLYGQYKDLSDLWAGASVGQPQYGGGQAYGALGGQLGGMFDQYQQNQKKQKGMDLLGNTLSQGWSALMGGGNK